MSGMVFGRLTVMRRAGSDPHGQATWHCRCACGMTTIVVGGELRRGNSTSCGCYRREAPITHGASRTPEHNCWQNMKQRCSNPSRPDYQHYGGKGIRVCNRWLDSFENFLEDIGPRPSPKHSIDRIDSDGDYTPENCRWATKVVQVRESRKLSEADVRAIRRAYSHGATQRQLATRYGVVHSNIRWIVTRRSWQHVA